MIEKIRQLDTGRGVVVEMRLQGPSPEIHRPNVPFSCATLGYCIFFPEQEYKLSRKYNKEICDKNREGCGSHCKGNEERIGEVNVSLLRACDYGLGLRKEFAKRGFCGGDIIAEIDEFFPVRPIELRRKRIGGTVLNEVANDLRKNKVKAAVCDTRRGRCGSC